MKLPAFLKKKHDVADPKLIVVTVGGQTIGASFTQAPKPDSAVNIVVYRSSSGRISMGAQELSGNFTQQQYVSHQERRI